ncbi:MAG TPA: rod shape-determining protein MreC [Caldilineae bacterium]|nr:rod shape-determining protein MreC [Caldilineae bacterium]
MMRNRPLEQPLAWTEKGAFVRRPRHRLAWLSFFVSLSLLAMGLYAMGYLGPARDVLLQGMAPVQEGINDVADQVGSIVTTVRDLRTLRQRNAELEARINSLIIENVQLKELEAENANLRRLLHFAQSHPFLEFRGAEVVARVIGRDPTNLSNYLLINVGREHGIREGMPVVTERGLVGRISKVNSTTSQVLLLIDPASAVNALIQSSRLTGLVEGQAGGELVMNYIPQDAAVTPGEIVITSGLGGHFPRNLVIGQIMAVRQRDYEMFQKAIVRPSVDFSQLEHVLVITDFVPVEGIEDLSSP